MVFTTSVDRAYFTCPAGKYALKNEESLVGSMDLNESFSFFGDGEDQ
jgi:hypothetical protein